MKKSSASSQFAARGMRKHASTRSELATAADTISGEEFDRRFDAGADLSAHLDWSKARRPGRDVQRVNVDFPIAMLEAIDREANRLGVTRQAFIKMRLADTLAPDRSIVSLMAAVNEAVRIARSSDVTRVLNEQEETSHRAAKAKG